jgi:hypothetical protein
LHLLTLHSGQDVEVLALKRAEILRVGETKTESKLMDNLMLFLACLAPSMPHPEVSRMGYNVLCKTEKALSVKFQVLMDQHSRQQDDDFKNPGTKASRSACKKKVANAAVHQYNL